MYSGNVPIDRRISIDLEIVDRKFGYVRRIVETIAGDEVPEQCRSRVRRIDWILILIFFLVAQGPPFSVLLFVIIVLWIRRQKRQHNSGIKSRQKPQCPYRERRF